MDNFPTTLTSYHIPLSTIAQWPAPNPTDPERRNWIVPFTIVLEVLATAALVGRLWARFNKYAGGLGMDDGLVVAAWVFGTGYTVSIVLCVSKTGFGMHIWDQDPRVTATGGLLAIFAQVFFLLSTAATKVSILLFFRRLIDRSINHYLLYAVYAGIAFTIAYMLSILIFLATFCSPAAASWQSLDLRYDKDFQCASRSVLDPLAGILSALGDIYAIVIPEIIIAQLRLPQRRKIVLYAIFGAGALVVVAALIRTGYFVHFHTDPQKDLTWTAYDVFVWTTIELQFALIYACIPALKSVVSSHSSRRGTTNRSYSTTRSFSKHKHVVNEARELALLPEAVREVKIARSNSTPGGTAEMISGKDNIVITRTVKLVSQSPRSSLDGLEDQAAIVERSFLDIDEPRSKAI